VQFLARHADAVRVACLDHSNAFDAAVCGGFRKPSVGIFAVAVKSYLRPILLAQREALAGPIARRAGTGFECSGTQRLRIERWDEFIDKKLSACYILDYRDGFGRLATTWYGPVSNGELRP
jgi:hypothetical protein